MPKNVLIIMYIRRIKRINFSNKNFDFLVGVDDHGDPLLHLGLRAAVVVSPYEFKQDLTLKISAYYHTKIHFENFNIFIKKSLY
jgi:hypothetical protein